MNQSKSTERFDLDSVAEEFGVDLTEPAPLDPSKVKAGDTVTLDSDELVANVTGRVTDIQHDHGAWTIYLTLGVMGHSTPFVVGVGTSWHLVAHDRPAPEPEPEWKPGTVAEATVRGVPRVRILRMDKPDRHPQWLSVTHRDALGATLHHARQVTDIRPLVVIDPAAARASISEALADLPGLTTWTQGGGLTTRSCRLVADAVYRTLGIEVS